MHIQRCSTDNESIGALICKRADDLAASAVVVAKHNKGVIKVRRGRAGQWLWGRLHGAGGWVWHQLLLGAWAPPRPGRRWLLAGGVPGSRALPAAQGSCWAADPWRGVGGCALQEFFVGSVTNYLTHHCKSPVLVMHAD